MKTAKLTVLVACLTCPACGRGIKAPAYGGGDTFDWTSDTSRKANGQPATTATCDDCGTRVRVPNIKFS